MPVSHIPPIPAEPDVERLAPQGDYVESGALKILLLGAMPTATDGGRLVNGRPPRDQYAGFGEGMAPAPVETPLPFPVAAARQVRREQEQTVEVCEPVVRRQQVPAPVPAQQDRVPVEATRVPVQADRVPVDAARVPVQADRVPVDAARVPAEVCETAERASFRRPPAPRPAMAERRAAPPRSRRLGEDPEAAFGRSQPRLAGIWVMLSSAAASILLLLLTSVGLSRYEQGPPEPMPAPVVPGGPEEVEVVDVPRPTRLAATEKEEF